MMEMPAIPEFDADQHWVNFLPSPEWADWIIDVFCDHESELFNDDHHHLDTAVIGVLFARVANEKKGRRIVGRAQLGEVTGSDAWTRAATEEQRENWFGDVPDFIITLDANWMSEASTLERCALIEHELYHCAHKTNRYGVPLFQDDGRPKWTMAPHDVEEFVGVVRRYGAYSKDLKRLVEAASQPSTFDGVTIDGLCGTCKKAL